MGEGHARFQLTSDGFALQDWLGELNSSGCNMLFCVLCWRGNVIQVWGRQMLLLKEAVPVWASLDHVSWVKTIRLLASSCIFYHGVAE